MDSCGPDTQNDEHVAGLEEIAYSTLHWKGNREPELVCDPVAEQLHERNG